jgi:thioredoxin reductase (NADPH)
VQYRWVDIEHDAAAMARVERLNGGQRRVPTIVFPNGAHLVEPTNAELAASLGLQTRAQREFYDLIVVGAGPAGLTAAL